VLHWWRWAVGHRLTRYTIR